MITVSVILPFHGECKWLRRAVNSILNQDFSGYELILINNHASRAAGIYAEETASSCTNVTLIYENETGIVNALNKGISIARGSYLARMDADDFSMPGRLRLQSEYLDRHAEIGLVSGQLSLISEGMNNVGMREYVKLINSLETSEQIYNFRFSEAPFAHPSVMIRGSVLREAGGYRNGNFPEDFDLWLRMFSKRIKMAKIPECVLEWNDHPGRMSRRDHRYNADAFDDTRCHYLAGWIRNNVHPDKQIFIWGGKLSRRKAKRLIQHGIKISGFIDVKANLTDIKYPVIHYSQMPIAGSMFVICMLTNRGKNREAADYLLASGYLPDSDFVLA